MAPTSATLFGIPATGGRVELHAVSFVEMRDGRLARGPLLLRRDRHPSATRAVPVAPDRADDAGTPAGRRRCGPALARSVGPGAAGRPASRVAGRLGAADPDPNRLSVTRPTRSGTGCIRPPRTGICLNEQSSTTFGPSAASAPIERAMEAFPCFRLPPGTPHPLRTATTAGTARTRWSVVTGPGP